MSDESEKQRCARLAADWMRGGEEAYDHPEEFREAVSNLEDMLMRERAAARAEVEAELAELRAEFATYQKDQRPPGCQCTHEFGDSPCPAHPTDPDTELPYEPAKLLAQRDALVASYAESEADLTRALDQCDVYWKQIAELKANLAILKDERDELSDENDTNEAAYVHAKTERDQLRAKVERVGALPNRWRSESLAAADSCAYEIEAALLDEGES